MASNTIRSSGPERLRVYHLAQTLCQQVDELLQQVRCSAALADQTRRCADSALLNTAEGAGHSQPAKKAYHYELAHGSVWECHAAVERIGRLNRGINVKPITNTAQMVAVMLAALIRTWRTRT